MSDESANSNGRRRPTIRDIAAEAGVSKGLVSLILNGEPGPGAETSARVLDIAKRLGYRTNRTARLLARRRTRLLGVTTVPSHPYYGEMVEEIQKTAEGRGYELVLGAVPRSGDERSAIETLVGYRCEALVLLGTELPARELGRLIGDIPTVSIGRALRLSKVDVVRIDEDAAMKLLIDHLRSSGHHHIAHVDGGGGYTAAQRRRAFQAAMRRHDLDPIVVKGGQAVSHGMTAGATLDLSAGVTAIVAFNDNCAFGTIDYLDRAGVVVPDEMAVTGFDDTVWAQLQRFDLTTISQSPTDQARTAVDTATDRIDGQRPRHRDIVIPPRLVIRSSTTRLEDRHQADRHRIPDGE